MHHDPDDPFDRSEFFESPKQADDTCPQPVYPLVYPVSPGWKLALIALGAAIAVLSVVAVLYIGYSHKIRDETGRFVLIGICAAFFLLGAYCIAVAYLTRVTL